MKTSWMFCYRNKNYLSDFRFAASVFISRHALRQVLPGIDCLLSPKLRKQTLTTATRSWSTDFNIFVIRAVIKCHLTWYPTVFDKMGLYHTSGELKCTTENYVTLAECDNDLQVLAKCQETRFFAEIKKKSKQT